MVNWWNELGLTKQIFYTIAMPSTIILIVKSIMSLIGLADFGLDGNGMDGLDGNGMDGLDSMDGLHGVDGLHGMDGVDAPDEIGGPSSSEDLFASDFRVFTVRGIIAFFAVFGWTGAALANGFDFYISMTLAFLAGLVAMLVIAYILYSMTKLQSSGNIQYENCIGKVGEVYLTVPPKKQGRGKVTLTVQERLIEVNAITLEELPIKSGESVSVRTMLSDHTAVVERV